MPIVRNFIYEHHADFGVFGLRPTWIQEGIPVQSIAHDILEHRLQEVGSPVTAELQAIGAILALRIENGAFYGGQTNCRILANMLMEMLLEMCREDKTVDACHPTRPLSEEDDWAERLIIQALPMAFELVRKEDVEIDILQARIDWIMRNKAEDIMSWVRKGFRHARQRFRRMDSHYVANELFTELNKVSMRLIQSENLDEGDKVTISVDPRRGYINIRVNGQAFDD